MIVREPTSNLVKLGEVAAINRDRNILFPIRATKIVFNFMPLPFLSYFFVNYIVTKKQFNIKLPEKISKKPVKNADFLFL